MNNWFAHPIFQEKIYEVSLTHWIWILALWALLSVGFITLVCLLKRGFSKRTQSSGLVFDELFYLLTTKTHRFFLIPLALFITFLVFDVPQKVFHPIKLFMVLLFFIQIGQWASALIKLGGQRAANRGTSGESIPETTINAISFIAKLLLWTFLLLLTLDNFGVDITALVTGLGIGGIAVALAVQNVLGDLFAYLSIAIDRPFALGDFLILDPQMGTVEKIGLKTTRIRSLSGEQIIVSNSDLLNSRIRNYKRMSERRVLFKVGVIYQTPKEKLNKIPQILKDAVSQQERVRFDRAHFQKFGDFSLDFEIVYYVLDPDYNIYMDIQQAINFAIHSEFAKEGIEFAYPTQTLFLEKTS